MGRDDAIVELDAVGSTNDWMIERAAGGAPNGLWVRADRQTAGRGRRGRAWTSEVGNLFVTTLVRPRPGEGPPAQLSFVAALALDQALRCWIPAERLAVKWPNDVLLDGVKCSGILLEGVAGATVIGFGVNLIVNPTDSERPATSLAAAGIEPPSAQAFAERLRADFAGWRDTWRSDGFSPVRAAWLARAHAEGTPLVARLGAETIAGRFVDLADDGALRLQRDDGSVRVIHAGEVFGI